jgi:DNA invertase Pin-like site-specific DNA recombinase
MTESKHTEVFALTRASKPSQTTSQQTQREIITVACANFNLPKPTFLDEPIGTSGRKTKFKRRPMGAWVLRNLRKGHTLIVTAIDRLGRNWRDQYDTIRILYDRGVCIIILKGWGGSPINLKDSGGELLLILLAWIAQEEGNRIAERTKEGLDHRVRNGLSPGKRAFTYIQAFRFDGVEITKVEYNRERGDFKRNIFDGVWLDQLCQLLILQKTIRANGNLLLEYCKERDFTNHEGRRWWNGTVFRNPTGSTYCNQIGNYLKLLRRMAVSGKLPSEWNERVLSITEDTPIDVVKLVRGKRRQNTVVADADDRENWTREQWLEEWKRLND